MPILIPGYDYDVFVSHRAQDSKDDAWVKEFVGNLTRELESSLKERVSIYLAPNPPGDVDDSARVIESHNSKLKCLVFIPIVSSTYCDAQSFAWRYELLPFVKLASTDQFGLKIKAARGGVSSRVLPVRIHDIRPDDQQLFEEETRGPLSAVNFVYKSQGVTRPLRAKEDAPRENENHTYYRDQLSQVAASIKDVISALREPAEEDVSVASGLPGQPSKMPTASKIISIGLIVLGILSLVGLLIVYLTSDERP